MRKLSISWGILLCFVPALALSETPVGSEFRVNTWTTSFQNRGRVAVRSDGSFVVVWASQNQASPTSAVDIYGQRYASNGSAAGAEFMVNTFSSSEQREPAVGMDGAGGFVVVWQSNVVGPNNGVFGKRYDSGGTLKGAEFQVSNGAITNFLQDTPSIAVDSSGSFTVVWFDNSGGGKTVGQRFNSDGTPNGSQIPVSSVGIFQRPSIANLGAGKFVVAWEGAGGATDGDGYGIGGRRFNNAGTPDGSEFVVNSFTTNKQARPAAAADASGNFVVVWQSGDNYLSKIQGQRYASSGARLGGEFKVSTLDTYSQTLPTAAVDPSDGRFLVAWGGKGFATDPTTDNILARSFSPSGPALGSEFIVNTFTTLGQYNPSVGLDGTGKFVVVWTDLSQDNSNSGIFGQRYGRILPVELLKFTTE